MSKYDLTKTLVRDDYFISKTSLFGLLLISPLSYYLIGNLSLSIISKVGASLLSGIGIGYSVGDYYENSTLKLEKYIYNDNIWVLINEKIFIDKIKNDSLKKLTEKNAEDILLNQNSDIGRLYNFIILIFIERFKLYKNKTFHIMSEIKTIVELITIKHPYTHTVFPKIIIKGIVENLVINNLKSYIDFYYLYNNYKENKFLATLNNDIIITEYIRDNIQIDKNSTLEIIRNASTILDKIKEEANPEKKTGLLVKTIEEVDKAYYKKFNKNIGCDDLLPLIILLLIYHNDINCSIDIEMLYDYLIDSIDNKGYILTILKTANLSSQKYLNNYHLTNTH